MTLEEIRSYCLSKEGTSEDLPFGPDTLVFRIGEKIFALMPLDSERISINLKCDPERAIELREKFQEVLPGYHMNKKHWNTVYCDGDLDHGLVQSLIDHSYELVLASLPLTVKKTLFP